MILILGSPVYLHINFVTRHLDRIGHDYMVLDLSSEKIYSLAVDGVDGRASFFFDGRDLNAAQVVWRSDKVIFPRFGSDEAWLDTYMHGVALLDTYRNICFNFACPVVNPIASSNACRTKINQLSIAHDIGMRTPDYLITRSINEIIEWSAGEAIVIKALELPQIPKLVDGQIKQGSIHTTLVDRDYLAANRGKLEPFPLHIQKFIKKKFEYRCVVVQGRIFSLRVDPTQHPIMEVDYRLGGDMVDYVPCQLPAEIETHLLTMMERLQLFSGCFDLIEDIDGAFHFLEVNPEGVWGKHDRIYEGAISEAFAKALISISVANI